MSVVLMESWLFSAAVTCVPELKQLHCMSCESPVARSGATKRPVPSSSPFAMLETQLQTQSRIFSPPRRMTTRARKTSPQAPGRQIVTKIVVKKAPKSKCANAKPAAECILDQRKSRAGQMEYLIKWQNSADKSWELHAALGSSGSKLIKEFEAKCDPWSEEQVKMLLLAYVHVDPLAAGFWSHVAQYVGSKTPAECQQKYEQQFEKQQLRDAVDDEDCDTKELTLKERTDDFMHAAPKQRGRIVEAFLAKKESDHRSDDLFDECGVSIETTNANAWLNSSLLDTLPSSPAHHKENVNPAPCGQFNSVVASPSLYRNFERDDTNQLISKIKKKHLDSDDNAGWRRHKLRAPRLIAGESRSTKQLTNALKAMSLRNEIVREKRLECDETRMDMHEHATFASALDESVADVAQDDLFEDEFGLA